MVSWSKSNTVDWYDLQQKFCWVLCGLYTSCCQMSIKWLLKLFFNDFIRTVQAFVILRIRFCETQRNNLMCFLKNPKKIIFLIEKLFKQFTEIIYIFRITKFNCSIWIFGNIFHDYGNFFGYKLRNKTQKHLIS